MKVFVSWSGELSRDVAKILRTYLPCMIQDLSVFMSRHDLESGGRWSLQLARELDQSEFGLICLTPDNLDYPWILFEAGALTKHFEARACGLLLNGLTPADVSGPLSQFQHRPFEEQEIHALLGDLNNKLVNPLETEQVDMVFRKWWPDLHDNYQKALERAQTAHPRAPRRAQRDILEEILVKVRAIQRTLDASRLHPTRTMPRFDHYLTSLNTDLTPSQVDLLIELSTQEVGHPVPLQSIEERYTSDDIRQLKQMRLIFETDDGIALSHALLNEYLGRCMYASPGRRDPPQPMFGFLSSR